LNGKEGKVQVGPRKLPIIQTKHPVREDFMTAQLRVYAGPAEEECATMPPANVRVRLGDLLPLVVVAQRHNYLWLKDFLDDEVAVTEDLYEILRAFQSCRPSA
jgi:hypothetical protein